MIEIPFEITYENNIWNLDILRPAFTLCSFMSDGFDDGSGLIGNHAT